MNFGPLHSNDMWPEHPTKGFSAAAPDGRHGGGGCPCDPEEQARLTSRYTVRAVRFIETNGDRPFFLYVAYAMPHVPPRFALEAFWDARRRSVRGCGGGTG